MILKSPKPSHLLLGMLLLVASCKEIIEPSIENRDVKLLAPANQYQSQDYAIGFWWSEVADALSYRLQIVSGSFASPGSLIQDTLVKVNKFSLDLRPGTYQWRVKAENGSTETRYSVPNDLYVQQSPLKTRGVRLVSPSNNYLTNQRTQTFQWATLYGATDYIFQIDTNNFTDLNRLVYSQKVQNQLIRFDFVKDQTYQWRVKAINDTAQSQWSLTYRVNYDHTPPEAVLLSSPLDAQSVTLPLSLDWVIVPTAIKYKLYIFNSDKATNYSADFPVILTRNNFILKAGRSGEKLYWCVSAIDDAGNEGIKSDMRSFVIQ